MFETFNQPEELHGQGDCLLGPDTCLVGRRRGWFVSRAGWSEWAQGVAGKSQNAGFLLSNQTLCANPLDNLIWLSFLLNKNKKHMDDEIHQFKPFSVSSCASVDCIDIYVYYLAPSPTPFRPDLCGCLSVHHHLLRKCLLLFLPHRKLLILRVKSILLYEDFP